MSQDLYFDDTTREALADLLMPFGRACCLCAPTVAQALYKRGRVARVLDIDERFANLPGFRRWDLSRPQKLAEPFDIIAAAPPVSAEGGEGVDAAGVTRALGVLARPGDRVLVAMPPRMADQEAMASLGLKRTGVAAGYARSDESRAEPAEFYANFALPRWFNPARDARPN